MDTMTGELYDGRYRLERRIGSGGMADVWLAEDGSLNRQVAIKILADRYTQDEGFVERFRREATAAAGLNHPNIVAIYDRGQAEGTYYIAMEYVDGPTLKQEITARAPLPEADAITYAQQALQALEFAHRRGVIHRDVKPHNMMITPEGMLKMTDFGIARAANTVEMTEVGSIVGTAQYLSPEQARGQPVGPQSDIYSMGIVLYEMVTGELPFNGGSAVEIAMKQVNDPPPPPTRKNRLLSPALEQVIMRALAKDPALRFRSAREMADELERVRRGLGVSQGTQQATMVMSAAQAEPTRVLPQPAGPTQPPEVPQAKRSVLPWIVVILLLAASTAVGYIVYQQLQGPDLVTVPNVKTLKVGQAKAQLEGDGFKTKVQKVPAPSISQDGIVLSTSPAAGSSVKKGSTVTMKVGSVTSITLPNVRGETFNQAQTKLSDAGFEPVGPVFVASQLKSGLVVSTHPSPGNGFPLHTKVTVYVSNGNIQVPDVTGMTCGQAQSQLQTMGLTGTCVDQTSHTVPKGEVISSSPAGGQTIQQGGTVTLTVSSGPAPIPVPNVVGMQQPDARAALENVGLGATPIGCLPVDPTTPDGTVVSQDPAPNTQVPPQSTVKIYVARATQTTPCP